jgi:hypothetical protein
MSEFKGTKGEWNVVHHLNQPHDFCIHNQGTAICTMPNNFTLGNHEEITANAFLIASAPELLEALMVLKQQLELQEIGHHEPLMTKSAIAMADRVIKKAIDFIL